MHLGFGDWLVVDSCTADAEPAAPWAALYLEEIGVPFETVRWLLASHWHDDHVAGISALIRLCSSAEILMSEALSSREFLSLALAEIDEPAGRISSGVRELRASLLAVRETRRDVCLARADQRLFRDDSHGLVREIWALSPSNAAGLRARRAFLDEHFPAAADRRRVAPPEPNEASVALLVRVGKVVVLLGADLENEAAADRGWNAVLASSGRPDWRGSLFKLAHHGADNGDHPDVWSEMLEEHVVATLTPYVHGVRPRPDDADCADLRADKRRVHRRTSKSEPSSRV